MRGIKLSGFVFASLVLGCYSAPPKGCECIGKTRALELLGKSSQHDKAAFGEEYGTYCAAWEDGKCTPDSEASCKSGPGHKCGSKKGCNDLWPSYNFDVSQAWCCDSWCYVDNTTCTKEIQEQYGISADPSWLNVPGLYYSYGACEDDQSFPKEPKDAKYDKDNKAVTLVSYAAYTAKTCPFTAQPDGCECTGINDALGDAEKGKHGADYGKWCAAWEDGKVTAGTADVVKGYNNGSHTAGGSLGAGCHEHWPTYDFHKHQGWCCDAWCYVPATCNATKYGIDIGDSWTGKDLKYSYGACADWKSRPTKPTNEATGKAADLSQYSCATCPYSEAFNKTGSFTPGRTCPDAPTAILPAAAQCGADSDSAADVLTGNAYLILLASLLAAAFA